MKWKHIELLWQGTVALWVGSSCIWCAGSGGWWFRSQWCLISFGRDDWKMKNTERAERTSAMIYETTGMKIGPVIGRDLQIITTSLVRRKCIGLDLETVTARRKRKFEAPISSGAIYSPFEEIKNWINCKHMLDGQKKRWSTKDCPHKKNILNCFAC